MFTLLPQLDRLVRLAFPFEDVTPVPVLAGAVFLACPDFEGTAFFTFEIIRLNGFDFCTRALTPLAALLTACTVLEDTRESPRAALFPIIAPATPPITAPTGPAITPPTTAPVTPPAVCFVTGTFASTFELDVLVLVIRFLSSMLIRAWVENRPSHNPAGNGPRRHRIAGIGILRTLTALTICKTMNKATRPLAVVTGASSGIGYHLALQSDVAKTGFEAMMRGDGDVVAGRQNKLQSAIANLLPSDALATTSSPGLSKVRFSSHSAGRYRLTESILAFVRRFSPSVQTVQYFRFSGERNVRSIDCHVSPTKDSARPTPTRGAPGDSGIWIALCHRSHGGHNSGGSEADVHISRSGREASKRLRDAQSYQASGDPPGVDPCLD
jgi:hypothetical protein